VEPDPNPSERPVMEPEPNPSERPMMEPEPNPSEHPMMEQIVQTFNTISVSSLLRTLSEVCIGIFEEST